MERVEKDSEKRQPVGWRLEKDGPFCCGIFPWQLG
jgi:hypothetical protein